MKNIKTKRLYLSESNLIIDAIEVEKIAANISSFLALNFFRKGVHGFFINCQYKQDGWTDIEPNCKWTCEDLAYKIPSKLIK